MMVFKFGGASVKSAEGVKNVADIISKNSDNKPWVVVSAMGKITNALEELLQLVLQNNAQWQSKLNEIKEFHFNIALGLMPHDHEVFSQLENVFAEMYWVCEETQRKSFDYEYDQLVSNGEILSTRIVAAYLNYIGIPTLWTDARDLIRADRTFREGNIDWTTTEEAVRKYAKQHSEALILTQGFIASTADNESVTLGREGSDYTASILAHCLNATEVVIWKDVAGVLNADPRIFKDAVLLNELSYYDAIEMTFYGATVIHPKTIKPLQNKNIPLRVKSFIEPQFDGTLIGRSNERNNIPCYIVKPQQVLISISPRDFSFIIEENIRDIFQELSARRIKVNLMQNSALKFSVCVNHDHDRVEDFIASLQHKFKVLFNENCELLTVRNFSDEVGLEHIKDRKVLIEQKSRTTLQIVLV
ncbi:MAG: aspartate kinase [Bacteroidia bacterium]